MSSSKVRFTAKRVTSFSCPTDKSQAFLWDADQPGLGLRTTPAGKPSYVFQGRFDGSSIRITIGSPDSWSIPEAQARARSIQRLIDEGRDPRKVKADQKAADIASRARERSRGVTVGEAWRDYVNQRRRFWGEHHYKDHCKMVQQPGQPVRNRPSMKTQAGILLPLMELRLVDLDAKALEKWATREVKTRPTRVRLAIRLLKAFLRWASEEDAYRDVADPLAASGKRLREIPGPAQAKKDYLQREQLAPWFQRVIACHNPVISAYLQGLLLTGARREELARLKWVDVNFEWKGLEIGDKVDGRRVVPLTPYLAQLLSRLPRRNQWVFSSPTSKSGRLVEPGIAHGQICRAANINLSLHGLRRSFRSLSEWQEIPVGIVAQIQGHKPSATAEKHYTVRPLDLLRIHHERIESWILNEAGVVFDPEQTKYRLSEVPKHRNSELLRN